jgi:Zn-dependent protease with chaperone function/uncharacterized tellurite resistance protein B-like protein
MDFFEAQARAKRRTNRLVALFALAVLGTIGASYVAALLILGQTRDSGSDAYGAAPLLYWDPQLAGTLATVTLLVVGVASLFKWSQLRAGGSAIAERIGGRRLDPRTTDLRERRLLNVVEEMAIASGTPVPAVFVLENEPGINAFAAGLATTDAAVAVTRGTLDKLNRDELQGVIAHEFSHILNGDMRLNVKLTALVFGILVIGLVGRGILHSLGRGRVRSSGGGKNKGGAVALILLVGLALLLIGYIGYFFGRLIQAAVSRQREFLADASAVQFTRNPAGISGALKKIGGYALGSAMLDRRSAEIGHFFFAQGFRSMLGGLWATHPPLPERIRAVEPRWDGQLFEPPELVDVGTESFSSAGLTGPATPSGASVPPAPASRAAVRHPRIREGDVPSAPSAPPPRIPFQAAAVVASIGALTEAHFGRAQSLLATLPPALRDATRAPATAVPLTYALVLAGNPDGANEQLSPAGTDAASAVNAVAPADAFGAIKQYSPDALAAVAELLPLARALAPAAKLPLLQLALPALRTLDHAALARFAHTLDELVRADGRVSPFEFALQKMLLRQLALARAPRTGARLHSFAPLAAEFSLLLSVLARSGTPEPARIARAFAHGVAQVPLLADRLALHAAEACTLGQLDGALDRLADAALPIRQRALVAAAHVIGADGSVSDAEGELYRAIAATLDCPAPSLLA